MQWIFCFTQLHQEKSYIIIEPVWKRQLDTDYGPVTGNGLMLTIYQREDKNNKTFCTSEFVSWYEFAILGPCQKHLEWS